MKVDGRFRTLSRSTFLNPSTFLNTQPFSTFSTSNHEKSTVSTHPALSVLLLAQATQGTITYTETVKMRINLEDDGPQAEEMRKMLPPTQSFAQMLYFNEQASLYREPNEKDPAEDIDIQHEEEGRNMRIMMQSDRKTGSIATWRPIKPSRARSFLGASF